MAARLLLRERRVLAENIFVEAVVWQLPQPVRGSKHGFKYRLALIVDGACVLRFDNEAGNGDHKHVRDRQVPYRFTSLAQLLTDFWREVEAWTAA